MTVEKIPTHPLMGRSVVQHDDRSRDFPVRSLFGAEPLRNKTWRRGYAYDQGQTSSCVGQTFKGALNTAPWSAEVSYYRRTRYNAYDFYAGGQNYDEWPGAEPVYYGTSALGVCKHLKLQGLISEYRWCFGLDDTLQTLSSLGPVGIGVWWYSGMWDTDANGFLNVSGSQVGGHEVELHGINIDDEYVIGTNSWGRGWGVDGRFKMRFSTLERLLNEQGDAVTVVDLP